MTLHSMTAYGYGETEDGGLTYACEIRSLNSRYLEVGTRLPRHLLALEIDLINHVKGALRRGKVDVFVDVSRAGGAKDLPGLDADVVKHYLGLMSQVQGMARGLSFPAPSLSDVLRLEGVLASDKKAKGVDAVEAHKKALFTALDRALESAIAARRKEGDALGKALHELLADLERDRKAVAAKRDEIIPALQKNYLKRIEAAFELLTKSGKPLTQLPEERVLQEVGVQSDKADIDEELTRLATHIKEFARLMTAEEAPGRKLDFMCQEMHREVNTMSNKLVQTEVSQHTLEMKQTIERIRQQVQNIE